MIEKLPEEAVVTLLEAYRCARDTQGLVETVRSALVADLNYAVGYLDGVAGALRCPIEVLLAECAEVDGVPPST
jgi:hypothetical protein